MLRTLERSWLGLITMLRYGNAQLPPSTGNINMGRTQRNGVVVFMRLAFQIRRRIVLTGLVEKSVGTHNVAVAIL